MKAAAEVDPFRVVRQARRRRMFGLTLTGALAASALAMVTWLVPAAVADQTAEVAAAAVVAAPAGASVAAPVPGVPAPLPGEPGAAHPPVDPGAAVDPGVPVIPPTEASAADTGPPQAAVLAAPAPPPTSPMIKPAPEATTPTDRAPAAPVSASEHRIAIDVTGYQAELDRCLWVRMDLAGASAPIVGAHNNCGGDVVLGLRLGDVVTLSGQDLDGRFVVVDSRDGRPGQDAAEATAGFGASVILQTCYFEGPDVRLVALVRVG